MIKYIAETYNADAEYPWRTDPASCVFRHNNNQKWFALIMNVSKEKLGLTESGALDILNVKCDSMLIGPFRSEPGIYPAYHMSKANWISVALDGRVNNEKLKILLDMSFELTALKVKKNKTQI